jgi:2-methylcitrate dehydratase
MPATVLGSGQKSSLELATFANGVMIRCLDFNDGFMSVGSGHPSDNFAPVLTCADAIKANGKDVIVASVLAYEVFCRLCDQFTVKPIGFDHSTVGAISSAVGASKVLGLSQEHMLQAINLATASNISLGQIRVGEVSMWKGCAFANAARNAVFATLLARAGMTGPNPIFEGRFGFFKAVTGPFKIDQFGGAERSFRIMDVLVKGYPCGQHAQSAIDAAVKLRSQISGVSEIAEIKIGTYKAAKTTMGSDAEKWNPKSRESADHSLPYVVAVALMYGDVKVGHFSKEYLTDPALLDLIQKVKLEETEECNNLYPQAAANRVDIVTMSGKRYSEIVEYHRGHYRNPCNNSDIEHKFHSLTEELLSSAQRKDLLRMLWDLEEVDDIGKIIELLRIK